MLRKITTGTKVFFKFLSFRSFKNVEPIRTCLLFSFMLTYVLLKFTVY